MVLALSKEPEHPKKLALLFVLNLIFVCFFVCFCFCFNDYVDICRRRRPFYNDMSTEKTAADDGPT